MSRRGRKPGSPEEWFWEKVIKTDACWEWTAYRLPNGYGLTNIRGKTLLAHRVAYAWANGPIPDGMTVDHLCFNPPCVNPGHLRLLTQPDNARNTRKAMQTHCINGHEFTVENTYIRKEGRRQCRACKDRRRTEHRLRMSA